MPKKITIVDIKPTDNNEQTEEIETQQLAITDINTCENTTAEPEPQVIENEVDTTNNTDIINNNDSTSNNTDNNENTNIETIDTNENVRVQKLVKCPKCNKTLTERGLKYYHKACPPSDTYQKGRRRKVPQPEKLLKPKQEEAQPPLTPPPPTPPQTPPPQPPKLTRQTSLIDNYAKPNLNADNPKLRIIQRKQQRQEQINKLFENAF